MPHRVPPRRRWRLIVILIIVAFISTRTALSYYVDVLWFRSLGYGDVFWKTRSVRWVVCAAFTAATFIILYGSFLALKRASLAALPASRTILIGGQPVLLPLQTVLRFIGPGAALFIAALTGVGVMEEWPTLALYWYAQRVTGGVVDPIFGKPLNFYLFTLPAWQLIAGWLLSMAVITCALAAFFILITGGSTRWAAITATATSRCPGAGSPSHLRFCCCCSLCVCISTASSNCLRTTPSSAV